MINSFKGNYAFLSNFYPCEINFDGDVYPSVEHAYQASKTTVYSERKNIRLAGGAGIAKQRGKSVTLRREWDDPTFRIETMRSFLQEKFSDPTLVKILLNTGDEELVEGNWWGDKFWGVCRGKGENHLGKLLMEIRNDLRLRK